MKFQISLNSICRQFVSWSIQSSKKLIVFLCFEFVWSQIVFQTHFLAGCGDEKQKLKRAQSSRISLNARKSQ